jgi:Protein of unknown function (DUF2726)/Topoisomerase DNA binding C4 zinc finger
MKQNLSSPQNPGCLASLLALVGIKTGSRKPSDLSVEYLPADPDPLPYRLRDDFLSLAEKSFYQVIKGMMGNYFTICPKVSLSDLFFVTRPNENKSAYNRINRKHVDFVICEPQTMNPLFAIELDDSSHERADRMERDAFVDSVFEAAQLPLLHVPAQLSYNTNELGVMFKEVLQKKNKPANAEAQNATPVQPAELRSEPTETKAAIEAVATETKAPFCPKCGTPMVLRTAKNGAQVGRKFYGCANYPKCRVILPFEEGK